MSATDRFAGRNYAKPRQVQANFEISMIVFRTDCTERIHGEDFTVNQLEPQNVKG